MLEQTPFSGQKFVEGSSSALSTIRTRRSPEDISGVDLRYKPLVSLVVPAYNESIVIEQNLAVLCKYMETLEAQYRWEVIVVNDGSSDNTGGCADAFAKSHSNVHVVHHYVNCGLGQALKTGFEYCQGDYIVTLDLDLSYSPDHIERLLEKIRNTGSKVVVASPYMKGGRVSNVPWFRRELSIWANRFLSVAAKRSLATLTGMVRVYDADFVRGLNCRSSGMDVNPEVIHKAGLMKERVTEIPAHLHWNSQKSVPKAKRRKSSMRILRQTWAIVFYGFLFRPVMFFLIPSLIFFLMSCYSNFYLLSHVWHQYQILAQSTPFPDPTDAVAAAFRVAPHTFFIGGMTLMLAIQLFSLGVLSMQSKSYFEEIFYLGSAIYKASRRNRRDR